ncbi:ABC transporter ATP-binding protein [Acetobacterium woodii]|uniref:ABC transport system ATP-binding protein n=1 Tax=Acetobacterium woodii (strain ATCC 29683 / DSM 1030 / JCM 2381 / KCTC 1655 / WB1) TaxID=931626 RepID=H6LF16_ACEWD|nr:ABC transporter ATP-binding protein [Acetobacterium woodii]AFA46922.1 ABC transport system ATP-binding protein [Acetobacterium woodii DSM 1030]
MNVIEINQLTKYYGKHRGIENVTFSVEEGEIFGFIGPNGAGKSTTIRTLLSLIHPTSGSATIFGKDCFKYGNEIRRDIGYLPSEVFYYEHMKVLEVLKYSASFYDHVDYTRIQSLAEMMDLDLTKRIDDLSYGNKKKVGIVQGLLHEPRLIILDEPTGGLDPLMQQKFFELIQTENKNGATILFSSHILSEVQKLCSRVAIIKDGTIIKVENIRNMQKHNYKKFTLEYQGVIDVQHFNLEGITNLTVDKNVLHFLYKGDINRVIERLQGQSLLNILIEEPSLEEIFIHYYQKED